MWGVNRNRAERCTEIAGCPAAPGEKVASTARYAIPSLGPSPGTTPNDAGNRATGVPPSRLHVRTSGCALVMAPRDTDTRKVRTRVGASVSTRTNTEVGALVQLATNTSAKSSATIRSRPHPAWRMHARYHARAGCFVRPRARSSSAARRTGERNQKTNGPHRWVVPQHVSPCGHCDSGPAGSHEIGSQVSYKTHSPQHPL